MTRPTTGRGALAVACCAAMTVSLGLLLPAFAGAQDNIPPMPDDDERIFIEGSTIRADGLTVRGPYNYFMTDRGYDNVLKMAEWGCDLYGRVPVIVSWNSSSLECDQMGAAYAERDPTCEHLYNFACVLPR